MKQDKGMLRSGRARLAALGAVALIAGGVMLYRHAEAQAAPTAHPVSFAPMALSPYSGNLGIQIAELDMLLPAVQHASRGFVIHVFSPVGEVN
ncbi:MAG TPA: hypothetical protein VKT78_02445, partial [Fimbriimonadaceae bacterium]|nr:hypothetical protein [Fimbriimonadaceae bacterium]